MGIRGLKDDLLLEQKREDRSKDITLRFVSGTKADVIDDEGKIKYFIEIDLPARESHTCTCKSFQHGNHEEYLKANGKNFECKHIKAAYNFRTQGKPEEKSGVL